MLKHYSTIVQDMQVEVYRPIRQWWEWSMFKLFKHLDQFYIGLHLKPTRNWTDFDKKLSCIPMPTLEVNAFVHWIVRWCGQAWQTFAEHGKLRGYFWNPSDKFRTTPNIVQHEIYHRTRWSKASNLYRTWKFNIVRWNVCRVWPMLYVNFMSCR